MDVQYIRRFGVSAAVVSFSLSATVTTTQAQTVNSGTAAATPSSSTSTNGTNEELGEVVVTGSRLSTNAPTPTPVTVVGAARLEERGTTNIADALNEIPSFRATNTPAASELRPEAGYVGGRILDLRGLGSVRTLTLVDGKRFTPSTTEATVDTNMIPSILLDRAEVVTGGASAQYGSDAVAGVVNLILNKKLDGFKSSIEQSITKYGDNSDTNVGLAGGAQ